MKPLPPVTKIRMLSPIIPVDLTLVRAEVMLIMREFS